MHNLRYKHYFQAVSMFFLATIISLWSWNTLAELFSLPPAQYQHVLAAFILLLILKWGVSSNHRTTSRVFGGNHEHQNY